SMHTLYVVTFETQLMIIYIILIHISRISTLSPYTTLFRSCQQPIHHGPVLFHFDGVFKFIFFPFSNMKRWAAPYSLGISPSNMASLMASLMIPISLEGFRLNVSMISSPDIGGWKFRTWSRCSTSTIFWRTNRKLFLYFLCFLGFLVVMSASQRVIRSSTCSPASKMSRRTAESVTFFSDRITGRELIMTIFWVNFIF